MPAAHRCAPTAAAVPLDEPGRVMRGVPRVARRRKGQCEVRAADREFVRLLLAEQDRAGVAQPHPGLGVLVRDVVDIDPRSGRRADAARLVDVLQPDRDAVQRPARAAGADLGVGRLAPPPAPRRARPAHSCAVRRRARRCDRDKPRSTPPATGCRRQSRGWPPRRKAGSGPAMRLSPSGGRRYAPARPPGRAAAACCACTRGRKRVPWRNSSKRSAPILSRLSPARSARKAKCSGISVRTFARLSRVTALLGYSSSLGYSSGGNVGSIAVLSCSGALLAAAELH